MTARELVSKLIARESSATSDPDAVALAASVLQRISADLCAYIGSDGCRALLQRALLHAEAAHPVLKNISISAQPDLTVQGVPESIQSFGTAETAAGLESTLVTLVELLGRLIGDELATKLVERHPPDDGLPDELGGRNEK